MKQYQKLLIASLLLLMVSSGVFISCTKYGDGFLSPSVQYAVNEFSIVRGRVAKSYSLITDGSSVPMKVRWVHIYNESGAIVDSLFTKKYIVPIWTAAYNPLTDNTFASISAKRSSIEMVPLVVNESNGTIEANSGTLFLPVGTYTMDLEVSNAAGTQVLKNIMKINILDGKPLETSPEIGTFRNQTLIANTPTAVADFFNTVNNPFNEFSVVRIADTPNVFILKVMDRNGVVFNPKAGEFTKRPNSGLNPNPPFLQNLQDYAPDTFTAFDTAMALKYPLVPFPIVSLGNGFNMYYRIPTKYVHIDSTSAWTSSTAGNFYKGNADSHYKGVYQDDKYDYILRIPMRIQVPGSYLMKIKILNTTHR